MHEPALVSPVVQIDNRRLVSKHRTPYAAVTLVLQVGVGYTGRMLPNHTLSPSLRAGRRVARRGSRRRAGRGGRGPTAWPSLRELVVSSVSLDPSIAVHVAQPAGRPAPCRARTVNPPSNRGEKMRTIPVDVHASCVHGRTGTSSVAFLQHRRSLCRSQQQVVARGFIYFTGSMERSIDEQSTGRERG